MPRVFLPAATSGFLLWMAFFPLDLGPIGLFALVPWLSLVRAPVSRRRRYFAAYVGGLTFFVLATNWVRVAHPMMYLSWAGLSLVLPLFWVWGLDLIRRLDRLGLPLAFSVPVVWVALEYFRMHFPTGYPFLKPLGLYQMIGFGWYFLGYTQHAFLPLIQIADVGGVYAVSFVVAAVNGMFADWMVRSEAVRRGLRWESSPSPPTPSPRERGGYDLLPLSPGEWGLGGEGERMGRGRFLLSSASVVVLLVGSVTYGFVSLAHPEFTPGPRVAAIQGSVPQIQKMAKGKSLEETYSNLHVEALSSKPKPDLIVWPETCFAADWVEVVPGQTPSRKFSDLAGECAKYFAKIPFDAPVLLGLNGIEWEGDRAWKYNSALLLDARGHKLGRYDKMHLVPFGEYVPFKETLPFMQVFTPYKEDYSCRPGEHWTRFSLTAADGHQFTFGCLICYEDSDPYLARQYVGSEPVNFLVNVSNDGWFDGTEEHEQHLAICRFRAIEARRAIVRSVNMGISGTIDSDGRVIALPRESWSSSKKVEGVVSVVVPIDSRSSCYSRLGDWIPAGCWTLLIVGIVAAHVRKQPLSASSPQ